MRAPLVLLALGLAAPSGCSNPDTTSAVTNTHPDARVSEVAVPPLPDAGELPVVACGADAVWPDAAADGSVDAPVGDVASTPGDAATDGVDDAGECAPPPSSCAGRDWIVYYTDGRCEAGRCVWERQFFRCSEFDICRYGACVPGST